LENDVNTTTNTGAASLSDEEKSEILDWVSACQSAYHIDSTPGHRFGGLGSNLEDNRAELIACVEGIVSRRAAPTPQADAAPSLAKSISDEMMDLVDRLGSEYDKVDPRAWDHLLVYVPRRETKAPEGVSYEHLFELSKKCGLIGAYSTKEINDRIVGYARVVLSDVAVQEAFVRTNRAAIAAGGAQEPIYQEMTSRGWLDVDKATYDLLAVHGEGERYRRIVYAAPRPREAATVALTDEQSYALRLGANVLRAAGRILQAEKIDALLAAASNGEQA